jgi:hypothetical protein
MKKSIGIRGPAIASPWVAAAQTPSEAQIAEAVSILPEDPRRRHRRHRRSATGARRCCGGTSSECQPLRRFSA